MIDATGVIVACATRLEAWAVRRRAPGLRVVRVGIGSRRTEELTGADVVISAGLAGGLPEDLGPGTVVVATSVSTEGDEAVPCDLEWIDRLEAAARRLRLPVARAPVLTTRYMVTGADRSRWAARGYAAVDLETGRLRAPGRRLAAVRVILDCPQREISGSWSREGSGVSRLRFGDVVWMARAAPRCALRAGAVLQAVLDVDA